MYLRRPAAVTFRWQRRTCRWLLFKSGSAATRSALASSKLSTTTSIKRLLVSRATPLVNITRMHQFLVYRSWSSAGKQHMITRSTGRVCLPQLMSSVLCVLASYVNERELGFRVPACLPSPPKCCMPRSIRRHGNNCAQHSTALNQDSGDKAATPPASLTT